MNFLNQTLDSLEDQIVELRRERNALRAENAGLVDDMNLLRDNNTALRANPAVINELLDRLEAAEKDIALKERVIDSLGLGLNAAAHERDALRALVVMRFDHDYPPQFTQGHDLHELTEPVTAEHCRWFVAEIERLRTDCDYLQARIEAKEKQEPVGQFIQHPSNGLWEQDGYSDNPDAKPLYLAPGAQTQGERK